MRPPSGWPRDDARRNADALSQGGLDRSPLGRVEFDPFDAKPGLLDHGDDVVRRGEEVKMVGGGTVDPDVEKDLPAIRDR